MIFYLAWKNILSRKSSTIIIVFIAVALTVMTVMNALFESTEHGVETVYTDSFTGDLIIRPKSKILFSLFGDETPMTGYLTAIPQISSYGEVKQITESMSSVAAVVPQLTIQSAVEFGEYRGWGYLFGVPGESYINLMPAISIIEGAPFGDLERGTVLNEKYAREIGVSVGDEIQFVVQDGTSARIRAVTVTGIYRYAVDNPLLNQMIIVDSYTVRSLAGLTEKTLSLEVIDENKNDLLSEDFDIESLFGAAEDMDAFFLESSSDDLVEESTEQMIAESTLWNYLIIRLTDRSLSSTTIKALNKSFNKRELAVEAVNWRSAAGSTALYLYWIRLIFNIGVVVILAAGFIVINNTLVVGVLNRTQEIGTLRAEGASRLFISLQCMIETFILTVSAGIIASLLGYIISIFISYLGITFTNNFLIQLFGSSSLDFSPTAGTVLNTLGISLVLGLIGWVYPVSTALKITPVQAMQGGN